MRDMACPCTAHLPHASVPRFSGSFERVHWTLFRIPDCEGSGHSIRTQDLGFRVWIGSAGCGLALPVGPSSSMPLTMASTAAPARWFPPAWITERDHGLMLLYEDC